MLFTLTPIFGGIVTNLDSVETLVFEENYYRYELEFNDGDIKITYTFDHHEPIVEKGNFINGKIIVNNCNYCYKIDSNYLSVYNPETDDYDFYEYSKPKSTHTIEEVIGNQ
jgi:hypothetical protein